jgi:beta-ureidopropionase / N-carbamoyl-L-amino-acid hydrolase
MGGIVTHMLETNSERFHETFERYSEVGGTSKGGLDRLALSATDGEIRDEFVSDLEALGLSVRIDEVGNIFGRRSGTDESTNPILIGSHLDSQPRGGRYDGQLGVLTALETIRVFEDLDIETQRPIEIVNWTNEEGSRFKPALMGSGAWVGIHDVDEILSTTDEQGTSVVDALSQIGYDGESPCVPNQIPHAYLELHIEQGPVLEEYEREIGIVEGILGMAWLEATIYGEADHAGPSPMHTRFDSVVAAADVITGVRRLSTHLADDVVTTVGEMTIEPNSVNVIPSKASFTIDLRSYDNDIVTRGIDQIEAELSSACSREGTEYDLEELWRIPHTEFSQQICTNLETIANELGRSHERMMGGAGHDASYLADLTQTGLVFVPSVDGKTHNEQEFTKWEDAVAGAEVFANTVLKLADSTETTQ